MFLAAAFFFRSRNAAALSRVDLLKQQIEEKNLQIKQMETDAENFKKNIQNKEKEVQTLKNQISFINNTIAGLNSGIKLNEAKITKIKLEIQLLSQEIGEKEGEIAGRKETIGRLAQKISEYDHENFYAVLMKNATLSSFFGAVNTFLVLEKQIKDDLLELKSLKRDLEDKKSESETKEQELADLLDSLSDKKSLQAAEAREKSRILTITKSQEKNYQTLLKNTEAERVQTLKDLEELEEKLRMAVDPSSLPPPKKGFLLWPAEGRMSQGYGKTAFAVRSDFYSFHNGIDIANVYGTPVLSVADGIVKAVGNSDNFCPGGAYGKYVLIDHNNNLITLYTHFSLIKIGAGNSVKRGQIIGYMGRSGLTTGSHLHFTVYDARTVEVRQSKVCGPLPYGGSIDPMVYL